jgi:membrane fusion protein
MVSSDRVSGFGLKSVLFRTEAIEEKRRKIHGTVVIAQPLSVRVIAVVLLVLVAGVMWFLFSYEFQRKETVRGYITSSAGIVSLHSRYGGVMRRRFVDVGDVVEKGAALFEAGTDIESTNGLTRDEQIKTTNARLAEIDAQRDILQRSYDDEEAYLQKQKAGLLSRAGQFDSRLILQRKILEIARNDLDRINSLRLNQYASDRDVSRQKGVLLGHQAEAASLRSQLAVIRSEYELIEMDIKRLPDRKARELSELAIRRNALQQSLSEQQAQSSYIVSAPIAGRVTAIQGEVGQELSVQQPAVAILPANARIVANLLAPSRAIGFINEDSKVNLRIEAFPYQRFGVQTGRVIEISRSSYRPGELDAPVNYDEAVYKVVVALDQDYVIAYGQRQPLQIDMTLTGDLVVDRRRLLDWMIDPLLSVRL